VFYANLLSSFVLIFLPTEEISSRVLQCRDHYILNVNNLLLGLLDIFAMFGAINHLFCN
jgi:hypothetical protein